MPAGNTFQEPFETVFVTAHASPIEYTLSYDLNGGTLETANPAYYTVESGDFTLNNPTKAGYNFTGWRLSGDTEVSASTSITVAADSMRNRTYIAEWQIVTYSITYELDGGILDEANPASYTV